jgi:adenylosuccinate lyase
MRKVFSDENLLQKWLDVEASLARAEAKLGIIPKAAAAEISRKAFARFMDTTQIKE